jgi:hypothetical protein
MTQMTKANKLADRIMAIICTAEPTEVFEALADCYAFKMSQVECPDCRKQAAHALTEAIPHMLAHANKLAADYAAACGDAADGDERAQRHTHVTH